MPDRRPALAMLLTLGLAGCSFAPPYRPPAPPPVTAFKEAGPWLPATPGGPVQRGGGWWAIFADPALDALEQRLDRDNPTLAAALGRYDQARAYLAEARGGLLPSVGIDADLSRNRQSDNRPLRGANQPDLYAADTVGGGISYELDLWARVRNTIAVRKAGTQASADDEAAAKLSLEAELAGAYIALRGTDQQIRLLTATVDAFAVADAMIGRRFAKGIASGVDTSRSGAELAETQAQLADLRAQRALTEHAIASLIGTPASTFTLAATDAAPALPPMPAAVASTLLERRPDVAAAERRMAAANAGIGVAKAAFFPSITLGAQGGFQNSGMAGLLAAPNLFWSVGPSTILTLFDGGRRRAAVAVARADWTEATADYRTRVLKAFQEVEDNLARLHFYGTEAEAEARAVAAAGQTEQLSLNRYVKGAVSYLDVVTAQTTALRVRRQALTLQTLRLQASVDLVRSLGGGWTDRSRLAATPDSSAAPASLSQEGCPMKQALACLALIAAATASPAADRLSFRQIESAQPRDPLTGNFVVYTDVHHSPAEQVAPALATLREAIPAGTSRADAERILVAAGARCAAPAAGTQSCKYGGIETVDEYLDEVKWHVRLALADDRVAGLDVTRDWRRH